MADEKDQAEMNEQSREGHQTAEQEEIKNVVTIEDVGPCKKKVTVEILPEKIAQVVDNQYDQIRKDADVPGFRKGRAPRRLLEKRFGKDIATQVKLTLLAESSDAAIKDNELDILGEPDVDHEKIEIPEEGSLKYDFEVEVRPEFELPNTEGIPIERQKLVVDDEQVEAELEQLCRLSGTWTPRKEDETVEPEDQIIADASLKVEDVNEAEKLNNIEVYVRPNGFVGSVPVENLDEVLKGAKAGDKKQTTIDIPKTFFREEYRGKKIDVEIEVKDIKYLKPVELNESVLAQYGVKDEDELKERIKTSLEARQERQVRVGMVEQVYKYMNDNTDFELPTDVTANYASNLLRRQYANLISRGLPKEKVQEQMETLQAGSEEEAKQQLKSYFIMDKLAEKLEIEVSNDELNGQIATLAIQQNQRPERLRNDMERNGSLEQFRQQVRDEKAVEKLLESAKITEVEPKKPAKKSVKKTKKAAAKEDKPKKAAKKTKKATKKTAKKKTSADKSSTKKSKKATKKKTDK